MHVGTTGPPEGTGALEISLPSGILDALAAVVLGWIAVSFLQSQLAFYRGNVQVRQVLQDKPIETKRQRRNRCMAHFFLGAGVPTTRLASLVSLSVWVLSMVGLILFDVGRNGASRHVVVGEKRFKSVGFGKGEPISFTNSRSFAESCGNKVAEGWRFRAARFEGEEIVCADDANLTRDSKIFTGRQVLATELGSYSGASEPTCFVENRTSVAACGWQKGKSVVAAGQVDQFGNPIAPFFDIVENVDLGRMLEATVEGAGSTLSALASTAKIDQNGVWIERREKLVTEVEAIGVAGFFIFGVAVFAALCLRLATFVRGSRLDVFPILDTFDALKLSMAGQNGSHFPDASSSVSTFKIGLYESSKDLGADMDCPEKLFGVVATDGDG